MDSLNAWLGSNGLSFSTIVQLVGGLLLLASLWIVYGKNRGCRRGRVFSERNLKILESKPLGNRQFLLVVAYQQEKVLLGVYPNGMQFLCRLPSSEHLATFGKNISLE